MSQNSIPSLKTMFTVDGRYRLVRKIGNGSFGDIYLGVDNNNEREVSTKLLLFCYL